MTPIENLKRGHFIAVVSDKHSKPDDESMWFYRSKPDMNGHPLEILSICLPFISVQDANGTVSSIDVRRWGVRRLSKRYVYSMLPACKTRLATSIPTKRKHKQKPGPNDCPRCSTRMIQRRKEGLNEHWQRVCRNCGYVEIV